MTHADSGPDAPAIPRTAGAQRRHDRAEHLRVVGEGVGEGPFPALDAGDRNLPRLADRAWRAVELANGGRPWLFGHGTQIARVRRVATGETLAERLTPDILAHELTRLAHWYARGRDGARGDALVPPHLVRDMLARADPPLPVLTRISPAPTFAPDGALLSRPGYHRATGVYYAPTPGFVVPPVPTNPTAAEVAAAKGLLLDDLLGDFPFVAASDLAHALALLLLPYVRDLIAGPTPLHGIEKPVAGSGGGLLTDVLLHPALGRFPAKTGVPRDEEELRKKLFALLLEGEAVVALDNLRQGQTLDSAALATALTELTVRERVLGASQSAAIPVRCIWALAANNPAYSEELARRTVRIRLDPQVERPSLRGEFRHADLRRWTADHRPELVAAGLTLVRAWFAAGRPAYMGRALGSYEEWCRIVGGILQHAEIAGFCAGVEEFYAAADPQGAALRQFVARWWRERGTAPCAVAALWDALPDDAGLDLGAGTEHSRRIRLGQLLGTLRDRRFALPEGPTVRVVEAGMHHRANRWRLAPVVATDRDAAAAT